MKKSLIIPALTGFLLFLGTSSYAITDTFMNPEDSYVRQSSPSTNYGSETTLIADGVNQDPDNGTFGEVATLIKWDVSSIPSNATIVSAAITLELFNASTGTYSVRQQNGSWAEGTVSWNDLSTTATPLGTIPVLKNGLTIIPLNSDGLNMIQGWVDGSIDNDGIAIRTDGTNDGILIYSKESSNVKPKLEINYSVGETQFISLDQLDRGPGTNFIIEIPVNIPHGSVFQGMTYYYTSFEPDPVRENHETYVVLYKRDLGEELDSNFPDFTFIEIGRIIATQETGNSLVSTSLSEPVDNANFKYLVKVFGLEPGGDPNNRFDQDPPVTTTKGIVIEYTPPN